MEASPTDPVPIRRMIEGALSDKTNDMEVFLKGIDYSYYYEGIED
mgnify:FL=1